MATPVLEQAFRSVQDACSKSGSAIPQCAECHFRNWKWHVAVCKMPAPVLD